MSTATLLLVRHGDTLACEVEPTLRGWTDVPLSRRGQLQARALGRALRREAPLAAAYASPLRRAADTARLALADANVPLHFADDLREIGCGTVDGQPLARVRQRHPELWATNLRQDDPDFRWPGGESYRELRRRALRAVAEIAARHPGERVLVVTHAGVIGQLAGTLCGNGPAEWEAHRPGNCSFSELRWPAPPAGFDRWDDRRHLPLRLRA